LKAAHAGRLKPTYAASTLSALGSGGTSQNTVSAPRERLLDSVAVAMRSLHNDDSFACLGRQARRVAHDHANRFPAVEDIPENLAADLPRRSGDDDHGFPKISRLRNQLGRVSQKMLVGYKYLLSKLEAE
jgi:hypothetical protein